MTGEEMERAIEFLLQSHATLEEQVRQLGIRIGQTNGDLGERIAETNRAVQTQADMQTRFIQVVTKALDALDERLNQTDKTLKLFIESQKQINEALVEAQKRAVEEQRGINEALVEGQRRTDDRVDRLAETVERFIREGRNGKG